MTAISTRNPSAAYDPSDVITIWTGVSLPAVQRVVGNYSCAASNKIYDDLQGGCVPIVSCGRLCPRLLLLLLSSWPPPLRLPLLLPMAA